VDATALKPLQLHRRAIIGRPLSTNSRIKNALSPHFCGLVGIAACLNVLQTDCWLRGID